jgi:hypothetical protein
MKNRLLKNVIELFDLRLLIPKVFLTSIATVKNTIGQIFHNYEYLPSLITFG